jgi:7 transmembrane helices usually fused to an inactive transglutaminase/Inactive transglutaminase fused to 7 transmembrane helices
VKNIHVKILALLLTILGLSIAFYKVTYLGMPLTPQEKTESWTIEAAVKISAASGPTKVSLYIPKDPPGFEVLDEDFIAANFGLATNNDLTNRQAVWAIRRMKGDQSLYYRIEIVPDPASAQARLLPEPSAVKTPEYLPAEKEIIQSILDSVRQHSADISSFTRELLIQLNVAPFNEGVALLREAHALNDVEWVRKIIHILAGAKIPARIVYGLELKDGARHRSLIPWLEVHNGSHWLPFDPRSGKSGFPSHFFVWRTGDDPLVSISGGELAEVDFSIAKFSHATVSLVEKRSQSQYSEVQKQSALLEYSLFSLPVHTQNVMRILLLLPVGAFMIAFLRNVVGIHTFGTFMPILIALAFRETKLLSGVLLFIFIISIGLVFRFYLEKLKLLLVPRLASVLIIVIMIVVATSVIFHKLGIERALSLSLFPVVVMSMTIERMSIVWEESGAKSAFMQGFGSLVIAAMSYLAMSLKLVEHLTFVFPELYLVLLAATLLIGRYSGYRLTELWRFRATMKQI